MQQAGWIPNELILASMPTRLDPKMDTTLTFWSNEAGIADLSRLLVFVTATTPPSGDRIPILVDELARITSIELYNSYQMVRGLGHVEAPAGVFSTRRRNRAIDLGTVRLDAGDTLAVTVRLGAAYGKKSIVGTAVPFHPEAKRQLARDVGDVFEPHVYVAAPPVPTTSCELFHLSVTFEENGVADLGSLQLSAALSAPERAAERDALPTTVVESIRLPSGENLIVGNLDSDTRSEHYSPHRALAVPATMFSHLDRMDVWAHLGPVTVSRAQQVVIGLRRVNTIAARSAPEAVFSAGLRFYPETRDSGMAMGRITASEFFVNAEGDGPAFSQGNGDDPCS